MNRPLKRASLALAFFATVASLAACGTPQPVDQPMRDFTSICRPNDRCYQIDQAELKRQAALAPPPQQDLRKRR